MLFLVVATVTGSIAKEGNTAEVISAETLYKMILDGAEVTIIDSRRSEDFEKEHITGAIGLSVTDTNAKTLSEVAPDVSKKIVFYCQNVKCQSSVIAASKAIGAGYKYVYEFTGGIEEWKKQGYPTASSK